MNHKERKETVIMAGGKRKNRKVRKDRKKTQTLGTQHKENKTTKAKKAVSGKTLVRKLEGGWKQQKKKKQHKKCSKKREINGQSSFCTGMQAQLHSPIMQQVLLFRHAVFP